MSTFDDAFEDSDEIALVGMAGRFPGAGTIAEFWQNLCNGVEAVTFFSEEELRAAGVSDALLYSPSYIKARGVLEGAEYFDAAFFDISPKEAEMMDPQHRVFLECAWEALEHAGYDPERFPGRIGIYAGTSMSMYFLFNLFPNQQAMNALGGFQVLLGNDKDFMVTRASYKLNLKGPSMAVQTACSTSLVAVHLACQSLLSGECDMALAGGCTIRVPQLSGYIYQEGGVHSPDGHTRTFDAQARGTIEGNGVGLVVLKRLEDALEQHDTIYAVIKGSAINNDGSAKIGYTAPGLDGQARVITDAFAMARVKADTIGYVEAHGTGTSLGDPIEVAALSRAFRMSTKRTGFCALGSVKTNIGHLDAAAGIAGLIKATLALQHGLLPPGLNYQQPNPQIDFASSPFYVNTELAHWPASASPRRAGVSSLGIGGTNAHIILEEAPPSVPVPAAFPCHLLTLSARSPQALANQLGRWHTWLQAQPDLDLADAAYTLQMGRRAFPYRCALVVEKHADALQTLQFYPHDRHWQGEAAPSPQVVFQFPGQGSQYIHMAQDLYNQIETFRSQVDRCALLLQADLGLDIRTCLFPSSDPEWAHAQLERTRLTQPALFVIEYALACLWMQWGIKPAAMIGHSLGEYVAACLAEVMTLEEALHLVAVRGRLMEQQPEGTMLSVGLSEQQAREYETQTISLAAINAPQLSVLAGPREAIVQLECKLQERGVACRQLHTSHAFHSVWMEPIKQAFYAEMKRIPLRAPRLPYISNVTGSWISEQEAQDANYWVEQLRQPVRFAQGLQEVMRMGPTILLEVGPGKTLSTLARQYQTMHAPCQIIRSLGDAKERDAEKKLGGDFSRMTQALGTVWVKGVPVDWEAYHQGNQRVRVALPTYPFERKRYWVEPLPAATSDRSAVTSTDRGSPDDHDSLADSAQSLSAPQLQRYEQTRVVTEPRNEIEQLLAIVWQELLGVEAVDIHDNFFELGGHSLTAIQLASRLREIFPLIDISARTILDAMTIESQANAIDEMLTETVMALSEKEVQDEL